MSLTGLNTDYPVSSKRKAYWTGANKKFLMEFHIQWTTKGRRPWITEFGLVEKLREILFRIASEQKVTVKACGIQPDHVHLHIAVSSRPTEFSPAKFMQYIKGKSSYLIKKYCPVLKDLPYSLWSKSYFFSTTGPVVNTQVQKYIQKQGL